MGTEALSHITGIMIVDDLYDYLRPCLPHDHANQATSRSVAADYLSRVQPKRVLDLGCGNGNSVDFFREAAPEAHWTGLDIERSPEVAARTRSDATFVTYNGTAIPFENGRFDFIYSHQVLEHVRHPESLLKEVARVLSPVGFFMGSTSQLEPYHSFSLWNYTVYGFKRIAEEAGLLMLEMRPGIDGPTLIERSYRRRPLEMSRFFKEDSPLNRMIHESAAADGKHPGIINYRKLLYCGQFIFCCRRADGVD